MNLDWKVSVDRLPLPSSPISSNSQKVPTDIPAPRHFKTKAEALDYSKSLMNKGYGVNVVGPDET